MDGHLQKDFVRMCKSIRNMLFSCENMYETYRGLVPIVHDSNQAAIKN